MFKVLLFPVVALLSLLLTACSWNHAAGLDDRFQVITTTELFAPSATIIHDTKTDVVTPIGGQSVFGQLSGPASAAIGGYLIGEGLSESGDTVNNTTSNRNQSITESQSGAASYSRSINSNVNSNLNANINANAVSGGVKPGKHGHH